MEVIDIRLLRSNFVLNYDTDEEQENKVKVDLSIKVSFDEEQNIATVILNSQTTDHDNPFYFDVQYGGKFSIKEEEKKHLERLYKINCPAIIFPFLREYVADLTRRAGLSPFHFGPVNFMEASKHCEIKDLSEEDSGQKSEQ